MVCYVSSPVGWRVKARRLYFSCACGMIAARDEEEHVTAPDQSEEGAARRHGPSPALPASRSHSFRSIWFNSDQKKHRE
jgi:hypothetical protein